MRGLTDGGDDGDTVAVRAPGPGTNPPGAPGALRAPLLAARPAVAGLLALGLLCGACSAGGTGTRDEGPAGTRPVAQVTPSAALPGGTATPVPRVNAVQLVKGDPKVGLRVRNELKPCTGDEYPVDTSYGTLTGGTAPDLVVNVLTCGDSVGLGTYVYQRDENGSYGNVFAAEIPAVYGTIDRGDLVVTTQVYGAKDTVAFPSGEDVITYRWATDRFDETDRVHNDFNRAVGTREGALPEPTAQN
ncbi:hypothetical protein OG909_13060 [Streptomyces sp. NBC_01754]|uniref:hypothetical protein n=1 Tax=Streptomyces sp. NBC_01754 TaxID=2975930 RepID=UPI002DDA0B3F|nr:hypothetical protein [Streptomyces sp. NBC_01754]WSC93147.1 hypothetical protein OG909_13060 [Streptomyces sp. NBC_01754]